MPTPRPKKSEATRRRVLEAALALFRKHGFDATTMRDVAAACDLSLGAAYYYFRSKDDIVLAWYQRTQDEHRERARAAFAGAHTLRERLGAVIHAKLDAVEGERRLLGVLFRAASDPDHRLSVFAPGTGKVRAESVGVFLEALDGTGLPDDLRAMLGPSLWMMHLGLLMHLIHDRSPRQRKTRALADGVLDLAVPLIELARLPNSKALRDRVGALFRNMGWTGRAGR